MSASKIKRKGFTLTEIILVLIVMGILVSLGIVSISAMKAREDERNARNILTAIRKAGWDYSIRTEECSSDFNDLEISDPNTLHSSYLFTVECSPEFKAKACKRNSPSDCISVDIYGEFDK